MAPLLTRQDHERVAEAITRAEARTSGEIYCVITHSVATYRWIPIALATLFVLCTPLVAALVAPGPHRWPWIGTEWLSGNLSSADVDAAVHRGLVGLALLQIAVFAVVATAAWPPRVRLALTPPSMRRQKVLHAARAQFLAQGLEATRARTGLLLFVALRERQAVLIADRGIHGKVRQESWNETVTTLTSAAGKGQVVEGLLAAIEQCGSILATHFPPEQHPVNELPNRVVEL